MARALVEAYYGGMIDARDCVAGIFQAIKNSGEGRNECQDEATMREVMDLAERLGQMGGLGQLLEACYANRVEMEEVSGFLLGKLSVEQMRELFGEVDEARRQR